MQRVLAGVAAIIGRHPGRALLGLLLVTLGLGGAASQVQMDTDFEEFGPSSPRARALTIARDDFGASSETVQVVVEADGGDVISPAGLEAVRRVEEAVRSDPEVAEHLVEGEAVISYATGLDLALEASGGDAGDPAAVDRAMQLLLDRPEGEQLADLLSADLSREQATASAGLVLVSLADDLEPEDAQATADRLRSVVEDLEVPGASLGVFSAALLQQASSEIMSSEVPVLFGVALAVIVAVLALTYRRVGDVVIAVVGLLAAVLWMYGIGALLGPSVLGLTGPFTQVTTVIPVLLVGLGVDFAIHLTLRYREAAAAGVEPPEPARRAVTTVGVALALTAMTTVVGFLTNVVSPSPPIADFGVFTAVGVASAFVIMVVLVPAARTLLDRRRPAAAPPAQAGVVVRLVCSASSVSRRAPVPVLVGAVLVTGAASVAALQVPTRFSPDAFIPDGARVAEVQRTVQERFGGDLGERTFVLVEGDVDRPDAMRALAVLEDELAGTEGVRRVGGPGRAASPASLLEVAASEGTTEQRQRMASLGFEDGEVRPDADVAGLLEVAREVTPRQADAVLGTTSGAVLASVPTSAGQDGAEDLRQRVLDAAAPLAGLGLEVTVTSQALVFAEVQVELSDSQLVALLVTLAAASILLVGYHWGRHRHPVLGLATMIPTVFVAVWVVAGMWALSMPFNVLTITIASLTIAIGVDYGIHMTERFYEEWRGTSDPVEAAGVAVASTGGALLSSALTTAGGFAVLLTSSLTPIRQFGAITAMVIAFSLVAAVLVQPAALLVWARRASRADAEHPRRAGDGSADVGRDAQKSRSSFDSMPRSAS